MSSHLKSFAQYAIILSITFILIWISLRGLQGENKWDYLLQAWHEADKRWLWAMAALTLVSHLVRAERWRMLMKSSGHHSKLNHSFYSLMVGYLVNLAIPRGGELSRCYNLYKLDNTPVNTSFGTVVVERIVDLICLLTLIIISFLVESEKLFEFIETLPINSSYQNSGLAILMYVLGGVLLMVLVLIYILKRNQKVRDFISKAWNGFRIGLMSIFRMQHTSLFILYSLTIWFLYFLMSYAVLKAFPSTSELGFDAVLSLFAIGSIAMAVPLPGGTGSYHVLVPQGLVFLHHIPLNDAVAFTFIFHGWQTAIMIVAGAVSLLITSYLVKKRSTGL